MVDGDSRKPDADSDVCMTESETCPADCKGGVRARRWLTVSAVTARRLSPAIIRGQKASIQRELVRTARQLMREFGRPLILRRVLLSGEDIADPWRQAGTEFKFTGTLFDFPVTNGDTAFASERLILLGDKQCFLVANGLPAPVPGDQVVSGREIWKVIWVKAFSPAGRPVLFELHVRR
ncbi:hypothetical protein [Cupriavidus sp. AU9028]|uniref:hypothetical protein n=1 Tax=Cupriavidus sp. AU9028 TaxID=2871157 RepID=UPI001C94C64A|nr:hypothetical protein [Cupriavidus sp. AU9028]MBY4898854.1 hypothetical protein [Cupriavidus sp. AU9028]